MNEFEKLICRVLCHELQSVDLPQRLSSVYTKWFEHTKAILSNCDFLTDDPASSTEIWEKWAKTKSQADTSVMSMVNFLEEVLRNLADILTGKVLATDIIFPNGSMNLVEGIYKNNPTADHFNDVLTELLVEQLQEFDDNVTILEIGAGTGGTSAGIFKKLEAIENKIKSYCYTDISSVFLLQAEEKYGSIYPYVSFKSLDIEQPIIQQDFMRGSYDFVIATNVLHATKNIRTTLRNTKALLKKNGRLLLNEISGFNLLSHVTFGLLEGWWLAEDPHLRIPGSPGLEPAVWQELLMAEGYVDVSLIENDPNKKEQKIIAARSNGLVRFSIDKSPNILPNQENSSIKELVGKQEETLQTIKEALFQTTKIPMSQIEINVPFEQYGIDSILQVNFTQELEKKFGELSRTITFEYPTIAELANYLSEQAVDSLSSLQDYQLNLAFDEPLLAGHVLQDKCVVVGAMYASICINAICEQNKSLACVQIEKLKYAMPIEGLKDEKLTIKVGNTENNNRLRVQYKKVRLDDWQTVASGKQFSASVGEMGALDISQLTNTMQQVNDFKAVYDFGYPLLKWSDTFKVIKNFYIKEQVILAQIELSDLVGNRYLLSPVITNSIYLAVLYLLDKQGVKESYLPVGIERVIFKKLPKVQQCWLLIENFQTAGNKISFDAKVADNSGKAFANYAGYELKINKEISPQSFIVSKNNNEILALNEVDEGGPIFWIHAGFGGVENYHQIASSVNRPFFGIQAKGYMTDDKPLSTIDEMAACYVNMIISTQKQGPYDLGGFSLGGVIAYEIARRLQDINKAVNSIVMIDSFIPFEQGKPLVKTLMLQAVNTLLGNQIKNATNLTANLINYETMDLTENNDLFLKRLVDLAKQRGLNRSEKQIYRFVKQHIKIQQAYFFEEYKVLPLRDRENIRCYYFCNKSGIFLGELAPFFSMSRNDDSVNATEPWKLWQKAIPNTELIDINSSTHMEILTNPSSIKTIVTKCKDIYV